jgi:uncharacterized membrane protein YcaP (DUF421 family)
MKEPYLFFSNWADLGQIFLTGVVVYLGLLIMLRLSGNRTLTQMNAFDFIVTVALGSTVASTLLSKDVSIMGGVTALATLIGMQYLVTMFGVRSKKFKDVVKGQPALLFYRGQMMEDLLFHNRLRKEEIRAAMRYKGFAEMENVEAVILETDGQLTVLPKPSENKEATSMVHDVPHYPPEASRLS